MTSKNDCWFYYNASCTKADCPFRHEPLAVGNPVCDLWKAKSCTRKPCRFRHSNIELLKSIPCYYESQPTGCLNISCQFTHTKPRLLLTNPPRAHAMGILPRNIPFQSRFPQNPHQLRNAFGNDPMTGLYSSLVNRNQLFPDQRQQHLRPRLISNNIENRIRNSFNNIPMAPLKMFRPPNVINNTNDPVQNVIMKQQNIFSGGNVRAGLNSRGGLLPTPVPPVQFPSTQLLSLLHESAKQTRAKDDKKSRNSVRNSYKRTIKKYEEIRHRKRERESKRRIVRKLSHEGLSEEKKQKKLKRKKNAKDHSSKRHKLPESVSKSKKPELDSRNPIASAEDLTENTEDESFVDLNLAFKVKSLDEILREKALKNSQQTENQNAVESDNSNDAFHPPNSSFSQKNEEMAPQCPVDETREDDKNRAKVECVKNEIGLKSPKPLTSSTRLTSLPPLKPLRSSALLSPVPPLKPLTSSTWASPVPPLKPLKSRNNIVEKESCESRPLPSLRRLQPLAKTSENENSSKKPLKRRRKESGDEAQITRAKKSQMIEMKTKSKNPITGTDSAQSDCNLMTRHTLTRLIRKPKREVLFSTGKTYLGLLQSEVSPEDRSDTASSDDSRQVSNHEGIPKNNTIISLARKRKLPDNQSENTIISSGNDESANNCGKDGGKHTVLSQNLFSDSKSAIDDVVKKNSINADSASLDGNAVNKDSLSSSRTNVLSEKSTDEDLGKDRNYIKLNKAAHENRKAQQTDREINVNKSKRLIKLNRRRFTESGNQDGMSRIFLNAVGRKMKVNKLEQSKTQKKAIVNPVVFNSTGTLQATKNLQDSATLVMAKSNEDSENRSQSKKTASVGRLTDEVTGLECSEKTVAEGATVKSSGNDVLKNCEILPVTTYENISDKVEDLNGRTNVSVVDRKMVTNPCASRESILILSNSSSEGRKTYSRGEDFDLDDINDEGEDFLEEVLAELPPEDGVTEDINDDDLLLEMEEILNS